MREACDEPAIGAFSCVNCCLPSCGSTMQFPHASGPPDKSPPERSSPAHSVLRGSERATPQSLSTLLLNGLRQHPDKAAIVHAQGVTTYAQLTTQAAAIARTLTDQGHSPGTRVAVLQPRDQLLVPTLVGILWAQCAYVPLDPGYPTQRLRSTLDHAGVGLLMGPAKLTTTIAGALPTLDPASCDSSPKRGAELDELNLLTLKDGNAELPANLIYTSGTTGIPKGVVVPRSALANLLANLQCVPGISASDRVLGLSTIVFDIHTLELLATLCASATIVLADEEVAANPTALLALINAHDVTLVQATPSMWGLLVAAGLGPRPHTRGVAGGERLPPALAATLTEQLATLWNMYGPTEATVYATAHQCTPQQNVTIGQPLANVTVAVIDSNRLLLPVGEVGELAIAGVGLASGYWQDSATTEERFIPLAAGAGSERFYLTGDQAFIDQQGNVHCNGRLDQQIKLRGHRVELSEIEHALLAHDALSEAACAVHSYGPADDRLVAYYTNPEVAVASLRTHLTAQLPAYMVPQQYVHVASLPRLPSGKLNRPALPRPLQRNTTQSRTQQQNSAERDLLGGLWQELLGGEYPAATDNFIDCGGHSLLALKLIQEVATDRGKDLPVSMMVLENFSTLVHHLDTQQDAQLFNLSKTQPSLLKRLRLWLNSGSKE